jgi:hypothetical protein
MMQTLNIYLLFFSDLKDIRTDQYILLIMIFIIYIVLIDQLIKALSYDTQP